VKRFDYYADQNPWKMPKWVGALLGGIFTVVAVGAVVLIVRLSRPAHASALIAEPTADPAAAVETPPPPATSTVPSQVAPAPARHAKAHAGPRTSKHAKLTNNNSAAILAKHDSHAKRKAKDDLDRMLGL
jgi:hypothetical protein